MADINLYEAHQDRINRSTKMSYGFLFFSVFCVALALGGYYGMSAWAKTKDAVIADLDAQIATAKGNLTATNEEMGQLHDVFLRLKTLKELQTVSASAKLLEEVQKDTVNGALLSDYEYNREKNTIVINGDASDFETLLQQMKRYKGDANFSSVTLTKTGISDKGGFILFGIELGVSSKK